MQYDSLKAICDPVTGRVINIHPILPVVDAPAFQRLRGLRQLGLTSLAKPAANHTRFSHSLGAYEGTRTLADRWVAQGSISRREGNALAMFALLHDLGHSAFSHTTEDFCPRDHKETTCGLIASLKEHIEACNVDHDLVVKLAAHKHPLHAAVSDKNLGQEKLDYLVRDGFYTGHGRPPGIEYLQEYRYFLDNRMVIDKKVIDHAVRTMEFYMDMYKEVYLRKSVVIAQRMFHKMVFSLIKSGDLLPEQLPDLTDDELIGIAFCSKEPIVCDLYRQLFRERRLFKEVFVIRPESKERETRIANKSITVYGVSRERMAHLLRAHALQKRNHDLLAEVEALIAARVGIPAESILVVPPFYPERFVATDVGVLTGSGRIASLREWRPEHFTSLEAIAQLHVALRVCVPEEYRAALCEQRAVVAIKEALFSL